MLKKQDWKTVNINIFKNILGYICFIFVHLYWVIVTGFRSNRVFFIFTVQLVTWGKSGIEKALLSLKIFKLDINAR